MAVPLVQLHPRAPALPRPAAGLAAGVRKPGWLRVPAPGGPTYLQVKATLRELGFIRAVALDGGMKSWRESGYPVETSAD